MKYQVMPPLSAEEFDALKSDIAERGVQVPVVVDEHDEIIDGYHRARACKELGIDYPRDIREGLSEDEKFALAYALNLHRRHLTKEQRVQIEADMRRRGWSYRRIAEAVGVEPSTVMRDIRGVANATPDRIEGADGKLYAPEKARIMTETKAWHAEEAEAPEHDAQPPSPKVEAEVAVAPARESTSTAASKNLEVHFSSERMDWATPWPFFRRLDEEFNFELDVCALPQSAKCGRFFTPEDDGLSQSWSGVCWMNPPYGNEIGDWMRKAYEESRRNATVVCLVPSRTDTNWWHEYAMKADEIRFVRGRLKFDGAETSAPFPSAVVVIRPGCEGPPRISAVRADG